MKLYFISGDVLLRDSELGRLQRIDDEPAVVSQWLLDHQQDLCWQAVDLWCFVGSRFEHLRAVSQLDGPRGGPSVQFLRFVQRGEEKAAAPKSEDKGLGQPSIDGGGEEEKGGMMKMIAQLIRYCVPATGS